MTIRKPCACLQNQPPFIGTGAAVDLDFDLQLTERQPDRVLVSVLLRPRGDTPIDLEGVEVMLIGTDGEPLSHRMLLPISGRLSQAIISAVELRGHGPLPVGAKISATAWCGCRQWDTQIPADPGTQLQAHCQGSVRISPERNASFSEDLQPLSCEERSCLAETLPWLAVCQLPELKVVDDTTEVERQEEELRAYCDDLGLEDDDVDWLKDLLNE